MANLDIDKSAQRPAQTPSQTGWANHPLAELHRQMDEEGTTEPGGGEAVEKHVVPLDPERAQGGDAEGHQARSVKRILCKWLPVNSDPPDAKRKSHPRFPFFSVEVEPAPTHT